jgi:hypothetical protein
VNKKYLKASYLYMKKRNYWSEKANAMHPLIALLSFPWDMIADFFMRAGVNKRSKQTRRNKKRGH